MTEPRDQSSAEIRDALQHYATEYCEGWCKDAPADANFDDCGGCRARLALRSITFAQSVGMREALIASGCTASDGTYVHASMEDVLRALAAQPPAATVETKKDRARDHDRLTTFFASVGD